MALITDIVTYAGIEKKDQYVRISRVILKKELMSITLEYIENEEDNIHYEELEVENIEYDYNGDSPLVQGYTWLKSNMFDLSRDA